MCVVHGTEYAHLGGSPPHPAGVWIRGVPLVQAPGTRSLPDGSSEAFRHVGCGLLHLGGEGPQLLRADQEGER